MILQLKELYKEKCIIDEIPSYPNDYYWFKDHQNHLIGINKSISTTEKRLISIMCDEIVAIDFNQHKRLLWLDLLISGNHEVLDQIQEKNIRFLFFNHNFDSETKLEFDALIKQFNDQFMALFIDCHYGVILDFNINDSENELEDFVEAMQQDFYYSMSIYQTESYVLNQTITHHFTEEFALYQTCCLRNRLVMHKQDLLLQVLVQQVNEHHHFDTFKFRVKENPYDHIEVVKAYLEHSFNLSLGAKVLHMHRNTFMNKLERFIQTTGLNVKEFQDALIAYLLIKGIEDEM